MPPSRTRPTWPAMSTPPSALEAQAGRNLPALLGQSLIDAGHDVDTTADEDLQGATDQTVIARATHDGRLLLTLDRGLGDVRTYTPGSHAGVIVLRLASQDLETIDSALQDLAGRDLEAFSGALVVYRSGELRVRWPTPPSTDS